MKLAAITLLAIAATAYLLMATGLVIVGPCTSAAGASCLLLLMLCFPSGVLLLSVSFLRALLRGRKNAPIITLKLS